MYYNVYQKKGKIYFSYKDEKTGKTKLSSEWFKPSIGVLSPLGTYRDIYGNKVDKLVLKNFWEYKNQVNNSSNLCGVIDPEYQFITNKFDADSVISTPDAWFIDIEVYTQDNFPDPTKAEYKINAVTLYSVLEKVYYTLSLKEYKPKNDNVRYFEAVNEEQLIETMLKLFSKRQIQILSGWNVKNFDIPYIINRIKYYYKDKNHYIREWFEENINNYNGKLYTMQILDYMEMYLFFSGLRTKTNFLKLEDCAQQEIGEGKVEHEEPLHRLYDNYFETFIDYNIKDVELLVKIDEKKKLLITAMDLANIMKALPEDIYSSERLWNAYLYYYLNKEGRMLPFEKHPERQFIGGYVAKPLPYGAGRYHNNIIVDLVSSYPHQMMQYNISPETLISKEKISEDMDDLRRSLNYKSPSMENTKEFLVEYLKAIKDDDFCDKLLNVLEKNNAIMSPNGEFYTKDKKGLLPIVVEKMFGVRKIARDNADKLNDYMHEIDNLLKDK